MQIIRDEIMLYISSNISFPDHSFYELYIERCMKQKNINNRIAAIDVSDKEIEMIIEKYFVTSNKKEFLLFLLNVKHVILNVWKKSYSDYAFFLCELLKWWDTTAPEKYRDKFIWNDELYTYFFSEIDQIENDLTIRASLKWELFSLRSQINTLYYWGKDMTDNITMH